MDIHPSKRGYLKERDTAQENPLLGAVIIKVERYDDLSERTMNALLTLRTRDGHEIVLHGKLSDCAAVCGLPAIYEQEPQT